MRASAGLHLDYVSLAEYQAARWGDVLGVATFNGAPDSAAGAAEIPWRRSAPRFSRAAACLRGLAL